MSLLPDWVIVSMIALAMCALVLGYWRAAAFLAAPAVMLFLIWPLVQHLVAATPLPLVVLIGLLVFPFLLLRGLHRLLSVATSRGAADEAMGEFLGRGLVAAARRLRRRRR